MTGYILNPIEFSLALFFHIISLIRLIMIFYYKMKTQKEIAPFMLTLLVNWMIVCILVLPYEVYSVLTWRPVSSYYHNSYVMFFIALPCNLILAMIPVSIFYLTIDRILTIYFGCHFGRRGKKMLMYSYGITLFVCLIYCLTCFLLALPTKTETECEIFGCLLGQTLQFYLGWRAFCSVFNFSSGIIFFILLYKYSKKSSNPQISAITNANNANQNKQQIMSSLQHKNNRMAILAIVIEFFLSFLPHFGPTLWETIYGPGSSTGTGPISVLMSSIEVLIFVSVYSKVLKSQGQNTSLMNGNVIINAQFTAGRIILQPNSSTRHTHQRMFNREQQSR